MSVEFDENTSQSVVLPADQVLREQTVQKNAPLSKKKQYLLLVFSTVLIVASLGIVIHYSLKTKTSASLTDKYKNVDQTNFIQNEQAP